MIFYVLQFLHGIKQTWAGCKKNPQIPVPDWFYLGLLEVGGNYMVTNKGVIASSYLVATQNGLPDTESTSPSQILDKRMNYILEQFNRFMGLHTYLVHAEPNKSYIGHIDCWGKFLDDDKVLIARSEDPNTDKHFDYISAIFKSKGFTVFRVMCQNLYIPDQVPSATTAAYTNSLILNDYVYVPLAGKGSRKVGRRSN